MSPLLTAVRAVGVYARGEGMSSHWCEIRRRWPLRPSDRVCARPNQL